MPVWTKIGQPSMVALFFVSGNLSVEPNAIANYIRYLRINAAARIYIPTETFLRFPLREFMNT